MTCATCSGIIEKTIGSKTPGVVSCQVNLAQNTGVVVFDPQQLSLEDILSKIDHLGFHAEPIPEDVFLVDEDRRRRQEASDSRSLRWFILALVLTVIVTLLGMVHPVGMAVGSWISPEHPWVANNWLLCILTIPVQFGAGARFYRGAWASIKRRAGNMDLLVALGTSIAFLYSLYLTCALTKGTIAPMTMTCFDTCCMLITFVLLGKMLEARAKGAAGNAVEELIALVPKEARVLRNGEERSVPSDQIIPGDTVLVGSGQRIPVDGVVTAGSARVDESMLTGESTAVVKQEGDKVVGATICLEGDLTVRTLATGQDSVLAQIVTMVETAQGSKAPAQRLADRIANVFVPVVIGLGVLTFLLWTFLAPEVGFSKALLSAIAVIVVACPCALGLATPTAVMVGMGRGAKEGILIRTGEALETMRSVDTVVFDKTGTLTKGSTNELKATSGQALASLQKEGLQVQLLSGDKEQAALAVATGLGLDPDQVTWGMLPDGKLEKVEELLAQGRTVAMVGDGINDAPALATSQVGIAMGQGMDVAIEAADIILTGDDPLDVLKALHLSKATVRKIHQNFFWALVYNLVMIPLAAFGILPPAVAGGCMAASSVCVVSNSLLLKRARI